MGAKRAPTSRRRRPTLPPRLSCNPGASGRGREVFFPRPWPPGAESVLGKTALCGGSPCQLGPSCVSSDRSRSSESLFPASLRIRDNIDRCLLFARGKEENNLMVRFPSRWTDSVGEIMSQGTQGSNLGGFLREWAYFLLNPLMPKAFPVVLEAVPRAPWAQAKIHRLDRH
jgi:hypothetical protein